MKIELWCIGRNKHPFISEGISTYVKRLKHYSNFSIKEYADPKSASKLPTNKLKLEEAKMLLSDIGSSDTIVLLDENGKAYDSRSFSAQISKFQVSGTKRLVFIIGGAFGFDQSLYDRANYKISLSAMTFSHQLIRVIFLEQLYRAFTIIKGEKYHND